MANLISRARALSNLNNLATTSAENTTLDALIAAVSAAIECYCRRSFASAAHDEVYDGREQTELLLDHFPILSVERVAHQPTPALRVRNDSAVNQRATARVTSTGVTLTNVASGVASSNTVAFADNLTLAALAAAIDAIGNGWTAALVADAFAARASSDLRAPQGAWDARGGGAELMLYALELTDYVSDPARGVLRRRGGWHGGPQHWRVLYTAGHAAVPDDVQEACAQWTAMLFWQTKRDPGLAREQVAGAVERAPIGAMPPSARWLLEPYRALRV